MNDASSLAQCPHMLFLSRWIRLLYVLETRFQASIYLSMHMAMHFCSELSKDVPGLEMHFLKHFSDIFVRSSWAFAMAICCFTWSMSSSFCEPDRDPVDNVSIARQSGSFLQFYWCNNLSDFLPICDRQADKITSKSPHLTWSDSKMNEWKRIKYPLSTDQNVLRSFVQKACSRNSNDKSPQ